MLRHMNHGKTINAECRRKINFYSHKIECGVEKKIQCKLCYKKFRRKWNLEQHQKRIHRKHFNGQEDQSVHYVNDQDPGNESTASEKQQVV